MLAHFHQTADVQWIATDRSRGTAIVMVGHAMHCTINLVSFLSFLQFNTLIQGIVSGWGGYWKLFGGGTRFLKPVVWQIPHVLVTVIATAKPNGSGAQWSTSLAHRLI